MKKNKDRDSFFSGFFWKFNEQIASQLVSFIVSIVLARILTPKDYGIVSLVNVFIVIANVFVTSGFSAALIQKKDATQLDFSTIFHCSLIFSFVIYGIIYLCAPLIGDFYRNKALIWVVRVFALQLPLSSFNSIQQAYVSRHMAFRKIFVSTTIATILSGILGIIFALNNFGVWALVFQTILSTVFQTLVLFLEIPWRPKLEFSFESAKELIGYGWKVFGASFLGTFFNELRNLIIGRFYSPADLAYYNRGSRMPDLVANNIDSTITSVLFPVLSKHSDDYSKLKSMIRRSIRTSTFIIMPLMFGLAVAAKPVTQILLTNKWLPSVPFMQCLCISGAFGSISNANMQVIKASGRSDILLKLELIKKPLYLIFLIVSIKINVLAVAISMAIYNIVGMLINVKPNNKLINYSYREQFKDIFPALTLSMIMGICILPIQLLNLSPFFELTLEVISGGIIYLGGSWIFKLEPFFYLLEYAKSFFNKRAK
ncbi:lipopolysaccharide biosynthesis protein [Lactobacillus crispatus]|uniref:lipopolysaccharide biosynthesis protein n=1 Tax=Lactobacillus crispatus TaxID=47770 RepID=UPI000B5D9B01|nr:lipopolysaccharide biosynthesis protein [Lactobacillus crispatus]OXC12356.1 lipopolysaccharide biosynthesis protein [Lactobacillus crispatus]